jgi:branched-chain amino acid transport system substrate-binding protein
MPGRHIIAAIAGSALIASSAVRAQEELKVGIVVPLTGTFAPVGKQIVAAAQLYMQQNGDLVAGRKIRLVVADDRGIAENSKRLTQDLVSNQKASVIGAAISPGALAMAPLVTDAKIATVLMVAAASTVIQRSPYFVRTSFTLGQQSKVIAEWAAANGSRKAVIVHSDWGPGPEASAVFTERFSNIGGQIIETIQIPLEKPDFSATMERARAAQPDTLFLFVPAGQAHSCIARFVEGRLRPSGVKIIGPGEITDDDDLPSMGQSMIGVVTAGIYSAAHPSAINKAYVEATKRAGAFRRPNYISVGGYDGMHLIYEALKKTEGKSDGDSLIAAMKGMKWESPRGPIMIDPDTRDVVQNVYLRKVERVRGELFNVEFATFEAVKDSAWNTLK